MAQRSERNLIGLDVNASRVRAVGGTAGLPQALPLDDGSGELPLALSLEGRHPEVGLAGVRLCRRLPHLACLNFLPHLGTPRQWSAGRHRLDAAQAVSLVLERLPSACVRAEGLALAMPAYLSDTQLRLLTDLAKKARLRVLGSVPSPLAIALTAYAEQPWPGPAIVLDADVHALTVAGVSTEEGWLRLVDAQTLPELGVAVWKERLLNAVADRCIRQSRRDLRDSALAEQSVYEQLDNALDACQRGQMVELTIQTEHWFQNLILHPEDLAGFCTPLVRKAVEAVQQTGAALAPRAAPRVVLLSASAGRLPGLAAALEAEVEEAMAESADDSEEDFGEALLDDGVAWSAGVHILGPDAAAQAALDVAAQALRGDLPCGHQDAAPLPAQQPPDAGPARLRFRGKDHLLDGVCFTLGRRTDCDLVFDSAEFPGVSARHCEIIYDRRTFFLRDRSRNGTLVNDRPVVQQVILQPGDWIRLGPGGPLLRFLGRAADQLKLVPTA
ncbi:MAG TPA: FHA domain-containing protein [Gemmataceae bacterium]|nr:FHA domain-containing protein [Gemmataceae bacterium]